MRPERIMVIVLMLVIIIGAVFVNDVISNKKYTSSKEKAAVVIEEPASTTKKLKEDKKHKFNMIAYTLELTYWDGRKDTISYKYVRDLFVLVIKNGNLTSTFIDDGDDDANDDGYEDYIDSKNLRTIQYGTGVLSFRILSADKKLVNNI